MRIHTSHEQHKHDGSYPIIGVNTFPNPHGDSIPEKIELICLTAEEEQSRPKWQCDFQALNADESGLQLVCSTPTTHWLAYSGSWTQLSRWAQTE